MKKQTTSKPKTEPAVLRPKVSRLQPRARSLKDVVGPDVYQAWVDMLRVLVPGGRTHRLTPLVAAMLQYALSIAKNTRDADEDETSVAAALLATTEVGDSSEVKALLHDVVTQLFEDAGVEFQRTSSRGVLYSIADGAYEEYRHWHSMPWE